MQDRSGSAAIPRFAWIALVVLTLANVLNYLDRQIPSILAHDIKQSMKLDDAELGFLLGTSFAVFYALVGIAMGRIADAFNRTRLLSLGLALWSLMTAAGGLASSFAGLSAARIGVGVGEATATPCANSLLSDAFPARNRATALGSYLSGTYIGTALALIVGGYVAQHWPDMCTAVPVAGACGVQGWQAALFVVAVPGLVVALAVLALREPRRVPSPREGALRYIALELAATLPPFTLWSLQRLGGAPAVRRNLVTAGAVLIGAYALVHWTHDVAQWSALGLGTYAILTWGQVQSFRDPPLYALTFGCRTFVIMTAGAALIACINGAVQAWSAPYVIRTLHLSTAQTGLALGLTTAFGSAIGVIGGGWLTDRWKRHDRRAPAFVAAIGALCGLPLVVALLHAQSLDAFLVFLFMHGILAACWGGAFAAQAQDLVLPRMRGAAAAAFALISIVVASGAGPYWAGKVSAVTGSLVTGLLSMQLLLPAALWLLWIGARRLRGETPEARLARAMAAGEPAPVS